MYKYDIVVTSCKWFAHPQELRLNKNMLGGVMKLGYVTIRAQVWHASGYMRKKDENGHGILRWLRCAHCHCMLLLHRRYTT